MIIEKPPWVRHLDEKQALCAIYSVDCHPSGTRFATGGGDCKVKIWSMDGVVNSNPSAEHTDDPATSNGAAADRVLCVLTSHTMSVNCVRWSRNGRYLASASDDTFILVYELKAGQATAVFGSTDPQGTENWCRAFNLRGHVADVLDCAWAPHDGQLASCSIDNTVKIWQLPQVSDSSSTYNVLSPLKSLEGHSGWVKGVTWDPVGKYLASSSEDRCVVVWRVGGNWDAVAKISEPFVKSTEQTFFRRLSWSPDGQNIYCPNAKKKIANTAHLLIRGRWDEEGKDLVGHSQPLSVCRYSPAIYTGAGARPKANYGVMAASGMDGVVSCWMQGSGRAIAVVKDMFKKATSDLAWSSSGCTLIASSHDGSVAVIRFDESELGKCLTPAQHNEILLAKYGTQHASGGLAEVNALVDNPAQLMREQQQQQQQRLGASNGTVAGAGTSATASGPNPGLRAPVVQVESRSRAGKKRVRPVLVSGSGGNEDQVLAASSGTGLSQPASPLSAAFHQGRRAGAEATTSAATSTSAGTGASASGSNGGANGLKRSSPHGQGQGLVQSVVRVQARVEPPFVSPKSFMPRGKDQAGGLTRLIVPATEALAQASNPLGWTPTSSDAVMLECKAARPDLAGLPARKYTQVRVTKEGVCLWQDHVAGAVTACCGNKEIVAVGTEDGSLYLYDNKGFRTTPAVVVGASVAQLECASISDGSASSANNYVMALTADGEVRAWDFSAMKLVVRSSLAEVYQSLIPAASGGKSSSSQANGHSAGGGGGGSGQVPAACNARIVRCGLTPEGSPLILVACKGAQGGSMQAFMLHQGMGSWLRVADARFALSDFSSSVAEGDGSEAGPVALLQGSVRGGGRASAAAVAEAEGRPGLLHDVTRSHLEDSMACALLMGSQEEFKSLLGKYAGYISSPRGFNEGKARALCEKLMAGGQVFVGGQESGSVTGNVIGQTKSLLKEVVLPKLGTSRSLQRLVQEFTEALEEEEKQGDPMEADTGAASPQRNEPFDASGETIRACMCVMPPPSK
ncbi:unnamed protein product [Chrysoparadoxa australica]